MAGLKFTQEELQADIINGLNNALAHSNLVRITNLIGRKENELRNAARATCAATPRAPALHDYLGRHDPDADEDNAG